MPLVPMPRVLIGVMVKNLLTGVDELPENATDEQKKALIAYEKAIKDASERRCQIIE